MTRPKSKNGSGRAVIRSFCYPRMYQPQMDKLKSMAEKRGISISSMLIMMINQYIEREEESNKI